MGSSTGVCQLRRPLLVEEFGADAPEEFERTLRLDSQSMVAAARGAVQVVFETEDGAVRLMVWDEVPGSHDIVSVRGANNAAPPPTTGCYELARKLSDRWEASFAKCQVSPTVAAARAVLQCDSTRTLACVTKYNRTAAVQPWLVVPYEVTRGGPFRFYVLDLRNAAGRSGRSFGHQYFKGKTGCSSQTETWRWSRSSGPMSLS